MIPIAHADDDVIGSDGGGVSGGDAGGGGGFIGVVNLPPVNVTATTEDTVYPDLGSVTGSPFVTTIPDVVEIGPGGGGSVHTPASKATTDKKTQNPNPCPDNQGDPIMMSTGNKAVTVTEFTLPGEMGLQFERFYNSKFLGSTENAGMWTDSIDFELSGTNCSWTGQSGVPAHCSSITFIRPDGSQLVFPTTNPTPYSNGLDTVSSFPNAGPFTGVGTALLTYNGNGYTVQDEDSHILTFNASGQLLSIKDLAGVGWTITHPSQTTTLVTHTSGQSYSIVQTPQSGSAMEVQVTDPSGNVYTYQSSNAQSSLSSIGLISSVTYPGSPTTTVTYTYQEAPGNSSANELTEVAYNGVAHDITTYDSNGNANSSSMADGTQNTSIVYSSNSTGRVATATNALGHVTVYQYNASGLLVSITGNASANCAATYATNSYDENGNMSSSTDNMGRVINYTYASNGLLQQTIQAPGEFQRSITYNWDATPGTDRLLSMTIAGYSATSYTYNAQGRLASVTTENLTSNGVANQTRTTTYSYSLYSDGMVASKTVTYPSSGNANTVTYSYNTDGFLTSVTNALGQSVAYGNIDAIGEPGTTTSINGDVTNYAYTAGRLTTQSHAHNGTTYTKYFYYDANSRNVSKVIQYDGETVVNNYDADFKVTSSVWTGPSGASITKSLAYDANGDVTGESLTRAGASSPDYSVSTAYDQLGRVISIIGNNGQKESITYNGNGQVASKSNALGETTQYTYDSYGRLQYVYDPTNKSEVYYYDFGDDPIEIIDPRGLATTYTYDGFGQKWSMNSPDTGTTSYSYDAFGRLSSKTMANGSSISYSYDTLNRVTEKNGGSQVYNYTYDSCTYGAGRLCSYNGTTGGGGASTLTYTIEGLVNTRSDTTFLGTATTTYSYDEMNRLTQIVAGSTYTANYNYTDDQVSSVGVIFGSQNVTAVSNIVYDAMRHPISWSFGNGEVRTRTYDADGRLTSIEATLGGSTIQSLTYSYDTANRVTAITNGVYSAASQSFGYDTLDRLTSEAGGAPMSIAYDANGNRTQQNWMTSDTVDVSGSNNQITSRGATSFGYDASGNRTSDVASGVTTTYSYDAFNQLKTLTRSGSVSICQANYTCPTFASGSTSYQADALGRRDFAYGPAGLWLLSYGLGNELTGEITSPASGSVNVNSYVWLNGEPVVLLNEIAGTDYPMYYMHDDALGRPEIITNGSGSTVWRAQNYAFDRAIVTAGIDDVDMGLPGQIYDANSGFWSNGFRDYASTDGRYLQSDPIGLRGGVNTYAYVEGNPPNNIDPLGLDGFGDMQGAFCPGGLCTLPPDMIQNSYGTPNMGPVYVLGAPSIAVSAAVLLPEISLSGIAQTALLANALNGAIEVPTVIAEGLPQTGILADALEYIGESFETQPPPPTLPVPTQPVAAPLAVPASNQTTCPR
ncbi:hypothetical protein GCM10010872_04710 [Dyella flava]|nr:hypothetical protein GCM10010872_04710 [Dyella flava]